ncbi:hypothetical protein ACQJBY_029497 [Aegilops geniculata]
MMHYLYQQEIRRENRRRSLLIRLMEEGRIDPPARPSPIFRHRANIIVRCVSTMVSLAILASLLVLKYKYHLPELQDPLDMAACVFVALCFAPTVFLCTQGD